MKNNKYIIMAVAALMACATTSCMNGDDGLTNDDWKAPENTVSPYGNNAIEEGNVITIKELKEKTIGSTVASYDTIQITEDWQLKARVTGNDIEGNIYNEIALEDESGEAILVCIQKGGLFGFLPVGQEILLNLKGLYIGRYGNMPQLGVSYTNADKGRTYPSRMAFSKFNEHFKLLGTPDASKVVPEEFDLSKVKVSNVTNADYIAYCQSHRGKLMTIKGVTMEMENDTIKWAPSYDKDDGNGVSRTVLIDGKPIKYGSSSYAGIVVRTSSYADFAAKPMPTGKVNLTGIFTVYTTKPTRNGYTWQILLRSEADIEEVSE